MLGCTTTSVFLVTPPLGGLPTKAEESPPTHKTDYPPPVANPEPHGLGGANRPYTLLKGDLEVVAAKGNLIIPRRSSATGCSSKSYPVLLIIIIIIKTLS